MFLLIDNSEEGKLLLSHSDGGPWQVQKFADQDILAGIKKMLKSLRRRLSDLAGVAVVVGAGRFTATRVAATTANTLAYALALKVVTVRRGEERLAFNKLKRAVPGRYVSAVYSGEANIGGKKKKQ